MCMPKNYDSCPCCGELVHVSELASNVSGFCVTCEDAINEIVDRGPGGEHVG